jgi:hypothetical protein
LALEHSWDYSVITDLFSIDVTKCEGVPVEVSKTSYPKCLIYSHFYFVLMDKIHPVVIIWVESVDILDFKPMSTALN